MTKTLEKNNKNKKKGAFKSSTFEFKNIKFHETQLLNLQN